MKGKIAIFSLFFTMTIVLFAFFSPVYFSKAVYAKGEKLTSAKAMAVIEKDSGRLLFKDNEKEKLPMASTTKIITAIFVIEKNKNLDKVVKVSREAVGIEGTSIGLKEGEHLTIRELLYGLMLRSGNDCAVALALETSGSLISFVREVNEFLKEKGCFNTNLKNPHGLPDNDHYTTAEDLAIITAYALKNDIFSEIVKTKEKKISNELNTKYNRDLKNKNKLLSTFDGADGVKTGFTKKAGRCFVGSATKNGMQLICVLLNCNPMFEECSALLNKGFNEFKMYKLISKGDKLGEVRIEGAKTKSIDVCLNRDFIYPLKKSEINDIKIKVNCVEKLNAPVLEGKEAGEVEISLEKQLIFSDKIYTIKGVKPNTLNSEFKRVIEKM